MKKTELGVSYMYKETSLGGLDASVAEYWMAGENEYDMYLRLQDHNE